MGIINTVFLEKGIKIIFDQNYAAMLNGAYAYRQEVLKLFTEVKSSSNSEKYGFLGDYPAVREWLGDKEFGHMQDYEYTITNKDWESSVTIFKNELEDDQEGIIRPRIEGLTRALADYKAELLVDLLTDGTTNVAYDGTEFFADRSAPNDNLLAGTGITTAQLQADLATVRTAMRAFETDKGRKFGLTPDTIVVPAALETAMIKAVKSEHDTSGNKEYNPQRDFISQIVCLPELDDDDVNNWYALCTSFPLKPFIYQRRSDPSLEFIDHMLHVNKELYVSSEMRGNAGYGMFHCAAKVVNS